MPISDSHKKYADEIFETLESAGIRAELDDSDETLGKKIRKTKLEKVPYFLVIGDKEISDKKVKVENRSGDDIGAMPVDNLLKRLKKEIEEKK